MERTQIFDLMGELKLYGMKAAFDEIMATAIKRQHEPQRIVGDLLTAEISEKQARSIKYQLTIAKLPLAKDMRRQKTGVPFDIPLLPELLAELELQPKTQQLAFLTTSRAEPFTAAGFGNWFRERCDEAGLQQCAAHGLRKAAAVRHALNGATVPELMAWFGWKTIGEAQRYIEEANRIKLAESAAEKVIARTGIGKPGNQFAKNGSKSLKKRKVKS